MNRISLEYCRKVALAVDRHRPISHCIWINDNKVEDSLEVVYVPRD